MSVVEDRVRSILAYSQTQSIGFSYQDLRVNRSLFEGVGRAVGRSTAPRLSVAHRPDPDPNRDADADYDDLTNTLCVYGVDLTDIAVEATIVHEAVHAGFDLQRAGRVETRVGCSMSVYNRYDKSIQETLGFLAEVRFWLNKGGTPLEFVRRKGYPGIVALAARLVPGQALNLSDLDAPRDEIMRNPAYASVRTPLNNG